MTEACRTADFLDHKFHACQNQPSVKKLCSQYLVKVCEYKRQLSMGVNQMQHFDWKTQTFTSKMVAETQDVSI